MVVLKICCHILPVAASLMRFFTGLGCSITAYYPQAMFHWSRHIQTSLLLAGTSEILNLASNIPQCTLSRDTLADIDCRSDLSELKAELTQAQFRSRGLY